MTRPLALMLASGSPRRRTLLEGAGVSLQVYPSPCDETWRAPENAVDYAARVTRDKAQASRAEHGDKASAPWILAADTTVWIPGRPEPLGKPQDRTHAHRMLRALIDAQEHRVSTAFCLVCRETGTLLHQEQVTTKVGMRDPAPAELERYLDTQEWSDKAGAYGIQGAAAGLVTRLEGSYTNVVGLPLAECLAALQSLSGA